MAQARKLIAALAGCIYLGVISGSAAAAVEINFWHGLTAADGDTMGTIVKRFEKENPGIKVKVQKIVWDTLYDKLLVSLAAGKPPEVFIVHRDEFDWFRRANALRIMDPYINGSTGIPKSDRVEKAWNAVTYNSKLYGVPLDNHNHNLVYNTDHFREAGLDPAKPPATGDEFIKAGLKLNKLGANGRVQRWGYLYENPYWDYLTILYQYGGTILNDEMTKATFNSDQGVKALEYVASFNLKHKFAGFLGSDQFAMGKGSMMMMGPWNVNVLTRAKNLKWAPAVVPQFGPEKSTASGSHCLFIPPVITGKKLDSAVKLVKYLSDHSVDWAKAGQIPVRKSAINSAEFKSLPLQYTYSKMLPYAVFEPITRRRKDVSDAYWGAAWKVMNGQADARTEINKAADAVNRILASIKKK